MVRRRTKSFAHFSPALTLILALVIIARVPSVAYAVKTPNDGDWSARKVVLENTPEARLMVRVGDIDNLGFGWPAGFDPFSGNRTPVHAYPFSPDPSDPDGTDRIMVVSSYKYPGPGPCQRDGYTATTSRPGNDVRPIRLQYADYIAGLDITSAILQIFVDDFQAPKWCASYQVTINGVRIPELENIINSLDQTGPVGQLITVQVPSEYLYLIATGDISIKFDDPTTGAGDGYAIDFVKLLINPVGVTNTGTIKGLVTDKTNKPVFGCLVFASNTSQTTTDADGEYTLTNVPAGLVSVEAFKPGYDPQVKTIDLIENKTEDLDFTLNYTGCFISGFMEFPADGATGTIVVQAGSTKCSWTALSDVSWITITSGATGKGNGKVVFKVLANTTKQARRGNIVAGGTTFSLIQDGK
jgi:hypothetical protein